MTYITPARKFLLAVAGLLLGIMIYLFYIIGGFFTLAGFLVDRATIPVSRAAAPGVPAQNLNSEILRFIGEVRLGGITTVDEDSVTRLIRAGLAQLPGTGDFEIGLADIELNPAEISAAVNLTLPSVQTGQRGLRLRRIATRVSTDLHAVPGDDGLLLSLEKVRLNRLTIPRGILEEYLKKIDLNLAGIPFSRISARTVSVPYEYMGRILPSAVNLEGLEIRQGTLAARLRVDPSLKKDFLAETSPLLREQGTALREAVAAAFPQGEEGLKGDVRRLASLGDPKSVLPEQPTALVSYTENEVWADPPARSPFKPEIGSDLIAGTIIRTGQDSRMEMILRDTSILKIGENTRFRLDLLPDESAHPKGRFALLAGKVRGRIAKAFTPDYEFAAPSAVCGVRGTDLLIELKGSKQMVLSVLEGSVAMQPKSGKESLVKADRQLTADEGDLSRTTDEALPTEPLTSPERERIESTMKILSGPQDAAEIRDTRRFWLIVDGVKNMTTRIMSMEQDSRERLGRELEKRLDPEAVDRSFRKLMQNPQFAKMIKSLEIEGIPYP